MKTANYANILIGVDGSKNARKAFDRSVLIAKHNCATLHILGVINDREVMGISKYAMLGFGNISPNAVDDLKVKISKLVDKYASLAEQAGIKVKTYIVLGDPRIQLAQKVADQVKADAVVIGATGVNAISRFTLGSTTSFVVSYSKRDVFVIRNN